jgi:hypothetical protein
MSSLAAVVGASATVTIGQTGYLASPVELYDLGSIEETVRGNILNQAARGSVGLSATAKKELLDDATSRALRISYYSREVKDYLASFRGAVGLIVTSLRFKHPDVDETAIGRILAKQPDQMNDALAVVSRISGFGDADDAQSGGPPKGEAEAGS